MAGKTRVLVTGASGFFGGNIIKALTTRPDIEPIAACRHPERLPQALCERFQSVHSLRQSKSFRLSRHKFSYRAEPRTD